MKDVQISDPVLPAWYRRISLVVLVMSTALVLLQFWQLVRGSEHWADLFPFSALLLFSLVPALRIKGLLGHILQFVSLALMAAAIVVLVRALGY